MKITALSGSLREQSSNTALLRAMAALAPDDIQIRLFHGLDKLPFFSPERDGDKAAEPFAVALLRSELRNSDAVVICTPEYAHGIPGVLKNALDWLVGSGEFSKKPVAAITASPSADGGSHAHASLVEVLTTMDAVIVPEASPAIGFIRSKLGDSDRGMDEGLRKQLRSVLTALRQAAEGAN